MAQSAMKLLPFLFASLLIAAPACAAQTSDGASTSPSASELDLALPKSSTYQYHNDPPGTWYGDTSRVPAAAAAAQASAREERCKGELHGTVAAGVGYSSRAGNSNWQAFNVNSCKTYYNDEGEAREIGVSISVGQYDGPDGRYGGRASPPPMRGPRR